MKRSLKVLIVSFTLMVGLMGSMAQAEWREQSSASHSGNLRFSPLGLLVGYINLDLDFPFGGNWSFGPSVSYWKLSFTSTGSTSDVSLTAYAIGARANYYPGGVYNSGMYVSPILQYVGASATGTTSSGSSLTASASTFGLTGLVGYHWFWDSFNLNLGAGVSTLLGSTTATLSDGSSYSIRSSGSTGLALDFMMGFAF